ncbi:MAG: phosphopantetheine-binding protein [Flavobacteriales bacterium]
MSAAESREEELVHELCAHLRRHVLAAGAACDADTPLASVGIDSMALLELVLLLERRHGLVIDENDLLPQHLSTVRAMVRRALQSAK